jgi:hypothetical protein
MEAPGRDATWWLRTIAVAFVVVFAVGFVAGSVCGVLIWSLK